MLIGYARISTLEQNLDLQTDALKQAGCEKLYSDTISGSKAKRPGLDECLAYARSGDTIVVWKLDRLGRNLKHLIEVVEELEKRSIGFKSLQENIDTTTPGGKLIFHVFAALAEFERDLIRERTLAGLAAARARGKVGGRPPALNAKQQAMALALHRDKSVSISEICRTFGVSRTTLYRSLDLKKQDPVPLQDTVKSSALHEPLREEVDPSEPVAALIQQSKSVGQGSVPALPIRDQQQLEAARRLFALGQSEQERYSFAFQQARYELIDVIPATSSAADLVEWARALVERADAPNKGQR